MGSQYGRRKQDLRGAPVLLPRPVGSPASDRNFGAKGCERERVESRDSYLSTSPILTRIPVTGS